MKTTGTTYYTVDAGHTVATVHKQGNWHVRLYISPDEWTHSEWATAEAAHSIARRHAASF